MQFHRQIEEAKGKLNQAILSLDLVKNEYDFNSPEHKGEFIKSQRKLNRLTQEIMAEKCFISRNYLSQIEKMERIDSVSFGIVYTISSALCINLYELID